ncbi:MAG TPA: HAMP domain-containing sensor histidine kinase [Kofleriaceae bacterium]|nr:HAMP domain-containing sensor histidine kinase [Kofleriaceae bacterium]
MAITDQERIAELEAELRAARTTIRALLDKAERRTSAALVEATARMEEIIRARTREVEEKRAELARANDELRSITTNLDKIVRQRTRALFESEAQLRRKNTELARLNELKAEFISIAAHELRTPMTSIVGYLDLMFEHRFGEVPAAMGRPLASVRRNAYRLTRLLEEMLDVSRIESGRVSIERSPCLLAEIVGDVVDELSPFASIRHQTIATELSQDPVIHADADKIHQVALNIVANSIRYTPEGGHIVITVDHAPQDRYAGAWARLRVRDDGVGIPASLRHRIFEPFSDVHTAKHHTSSGPGSAGLGLYIARGLVDLHGGLISVDSQEGEFTEFTVLLPLASPRAMRR